MKPRIGLALSGGGSKGAFTVGVLKVINHVLKPVPYPVIAGTSTGSLVGTLLTTNQFARLIEVYSTVKTKNIVNPHHAFIGALFGHEAILFSSALIGGKAIYDQSALEATIAANVDFHRIKSLADRTRLIYTTVDLRSGELVTFNNRDHTAKQLAKGLLASASMPVLTDPVSISLNGQTSEYVDGGVREFLPLGAVFDSGIEVDHIIAIATSPLGPKVQSKPCEKITDILSRTIDVFNSEVAQNDYSGALLFNSLLQMIDNAEANGLSRAKILKDVPLNIRRRLTDKRAVPVTFIGPTRHIEMNPLKFEPEAMKKLMKEGVRVAKQVVPKIVAALPGDA